MLAGHWTTGIDAIVKMSVIIFFTSMYLSCRSLGFFSFADGLHCSLVKYEDLLVDHSVLGVK